MIVIINTGGYTIPRNSRKRRGQNGVDQTPLSNILTMYAAKKNNKFTILNNIIVNNSNIYVICTIVYSAHAFDCDRRAFDRDRLDFVHFRRAHSTRRSTRVDRAKNSI